MLRKRRKLISLLLAIGLSFSLLTISAAAAAGDIKVLVNGTAVVFDQPPVIEGGRTLVPLRAIFEALGATVDYNTSARTVTAVRGDVTVKLTIDSDVMYRNGSPVTLDVPAKIIGGRTLVPVRAIGESFGSKVDWNGAARTVTITDAGPPTGG